MVCLEEDEGGGRGKGLRDAAGLDIGERFAAVDSWFSSAEQVEVGAVKEEDFLCWHGCCLMTWVKRENVGYSSTREEATMGIMYCTSGDWDSTVGGPLKK